MRRSLLLTLPPPPRAADLRLGQVNEPVWRTAVDWITLISGMLLLILGLSS